LSSILIVALALCVASRGLAAAQSHDGTGQVVAVDENQGTVTLDHGPISGLMPAMRMQFPVGSVEMLRGLHVGDTVRFSLQAHGSEWVIATIEPAEQRPPRRAVAFEAPDFTAPTLSGSSLRLSEFRGKVVLVNFWASWCVSCRAEMSSIESLYRKYEGRGLEVVAVNLDTLSTAGVAEFAKEVAVTFPIVLDPGWSAARAYGVIGLPTTYLIDRGGNVVVREVGARDWADAVSDAAVRRLLR
jgi:peroxiredoxin/Cu/Ag efflux protein CusF